MNWTQIIIGVSMLLIALMIILIQLSSEIGIDLACTKVGTALVIVAWSVAGVLCLLRGLKQI